MFYFTLIPFHKINFISLKLLNFCRRPNSRIAKQELPIFENECIYSQEAAWMDAKNYGLGRFNFATLCCRKPNSVQPLLILDSHHVGMMGSVIEHIKFLALKLSTSPEDAQDFANCWISE